MPNFGTDSDFARLRGRQFILAGSYKNGMHLVDISKPEKPKVVGIYDCGVTQGDVQVFTQRSKPGRVFAGYTSDTFGDGTSTCYKEAAARGFEVLKPNGQGKNGTFIADVTNPAKPKTVSFVEVPQGSHNHTIHPSGTYLYNSNSDLITSFQPAIEVYDISNFAAPKLVGELALPPRPGLGTESHDITFNAKGTRAYSAALSQGVIIDTEDPAKPEIVSTWLDPSINVWHQADPFTLKGEDGETRDFVIVEDEVAGAVGTAQCPNGGVHVYDITGENELSPQKVGYWNIDDVGPTASPTDSCTAHVFDIHEKEQILTIAYYNGGVRVVDLSNLVGYSLGESSIDGGGMKQIAWYRAADGNAWSAKTPKIAKDGSFYLYANDINRGLDTFHFTAPKEEAAAGKRKARSSRRRSVSPGVWLTPRQAARRAARRRHVALSPDTAIFCLLPESAQRKVPGVAPTLPVKLPGL